jgi:hypothetical protein
MSRKLMVLLVSSALVFGNVSTSAWAASDTSNTMQAQTVQTADPAKNISPLPPGAAAGIKQAQGEWENSPWVGLGLVAAIVIIAWILLDDDDEDEETPTTGT